MATIIRSNSCYESDSRYTKHYQQLWRYHNHVSGLMPLTNSYLTTILVHMLWHSGELHILAPLALLLFHGNRTILGWDIANYIFDLEKWRSRSWPRSKLMVPFEALSSINMFAFRFVAIGPFWDIANSMFDLENSKSRSRPRSNSMVTFDAWGSFDMFWPWKLKVKIKTKTDQNLIR